MSVCIDNSAAGYLRNLLRKPRSLMSRHISYIQSHTVNKINKKDVTGCKVGGTLNFCTVCNTIMVTTRYLLHLSL